MTKLHNAGQRNITVAGVIFTPGEVLDFEPEEAEKLRALYPDEVKSLEDAGKVFSAPEAAAEEAAAAEAAAAEAVAEAEAPAEAEAAADAEAAEEVSEEGESEETPV
jgi:hypothetical protein